MDIQKTAEGTVLRTKNKYLMFQKVRQSHGNRERTNGEFNNPLTEKLLLRYDVFRYEPGNRTKNFSLNLVTSQPHEDHLETGRIALHESAGGNKGFNSIAAAALLMSCIVLGRHSPTELEGISF
jgi:hypothetical protein